MSADDTSDVKVVTVQPVERDGASTPELGTVESSNELLEMQRQPGPNATAARQKLPVTDEENNNDSGSNKADKADPAADDYRARFEQFKEKAVATRIKYAIHLSVIVAFFTAYDVFGDVALYADILLMSCPASFNVENACCGGCGDGLCVFQGTSVGLFYADGSPCGDANGEIFSPTKEGCPSVAALLASRPGCVFMGMPSQTNAVSEAGVTTIPPSLKWFTNGTFKELSTNVCSAAECSAGPIGCYFAAGPAVQPVPSKEVEGPYPSLVVQRPGPDVASNPWRYKCVYMTGDVNVAGFALQALLPDDDGVFNTAKTTNEYEFSSGAVVIRGSVMKALAVALLVINVVKELLRAMGYLSIFCSSTFRQPRLFKYVYRSPVHVFFVFTSTRVRRLVLQTDRSGQNKAWVKFVDLVLEDIPGLFMAVWVLQVNEDGDNVSAIVSLSGTSMMLFINFIRWIVGSLKETKTQANAFDVELALRDEMESGEMRLTDEELELLPINEQFKYHFRRNEAKIDMIEKTSNARWEEIVKRLQRLEASEHKQGDEEDSKEQGPVHKEHERRNDPADTADTADSK